MRKTMQRTKASQTIVHKVMAYHGGAFTHESIKKIPCHLMEAFIHPLDRSKQFERNYL